MAKSFRPPSKTKPPAAPVPLAAPAATPAPQRPDNARTGSAASGDDQGAAPIEQQVEALIDHAQQQAQAIADLAAPSGSDETSGEAAPNQPPPSEEATMAGDSQSAPGAPRVNAAPTDAAGAAADAKAQSPSPPAADPPAETATDSTAPAPEEPVDPAALQSQVDAILSEAGYPPDGEGTAVDPEDSSGDEEALTPPEVAEPTSADLSEVDAVIAEAAQRALEDDAFEVGQGAHQSASAPSGPAAPAPSAPAAAADAGRPKAVLKGGDASMRRDKRQRRVQQGTDLDGDLLRPAPVAPTGDPTASSDDDVIDFASSATTAEDAKEADWKIRLCRSTLHLLALANAPWRNWPPITRAAVLALTIGNGLLALVAFTVVLRRLVF